MTEYLDVYVSIRDHTVNVVLPEHSDTSLVLGAYIYLTDENGAYLTDEAGQRLYVSAEAGYPLVVNARKRNFTVHTKVNGA